MVLQLEDCIDFLKCLYPEIDVMFLFDHSNGHDCLQPNGLSINKVRKNFGWKQPKLRSSNLTLNEFGPYHILTSPLQPGMLQHMTSNATSDTGPFYLSEIEQNNRKYDKPSRKKVKEYFKKEDLIIVLQRDGMKVSKGTLRKKCQQLCVSRGIATSYLIDGITEGWVGKPKGSFQILYERGWIDPSNLSKYIEKGTKGAMGNLLESTSLKKILEKQGNFMTKLTLLQYHAQLLGAMVDQMPKCHPELAGEGVEYAWALAKLFYRCQKIQLKRPKTNFIDLVRRCTSREDVQSTNQVRKCSRRTRKYMLGYRAIQEVTKETQEEHEVLEDALTNKNRTSKYNYTLIEKIIKTYKTHKNCLDTDTKWLKKVMEEVGKDSFELLTLVVKKMDMVKSEITKM